jgi:predicted HTH domain antitoxin
MKNTFTIEYPDTLPDAMNLSRQEFEEEAKLAMAAKLFELGRLSSGMAAQLAGIGRVEFLLRLNDYGVSMIDLTDDELENDVENA